MVNDNLSSWSRSKDCSGTLPRVTEANIVSLLKKGTPQGSVLIKTGVKRPALTNAHLKTWPRSQRS